ncbi:MAG: type VI secretion system tip protein TssI/VgrG [Polyangiaceae bacterium]
MFESKALDAPLEVRSLDGHDELNKLFRFELQLRRPGTVTGDEEAASLLDAPATVRFMEDGEVLQEVHGIVSAVTAETDVDADTTDLFVELVPRTWQLTLRRGSELYLERTIPEIVTEKLKGIGLQEGTDFILALREDYPMREIVAQYEETDHDFVSRLCEQHGIVTFFEHKDGRDVWILTDTQATHHPITRSTVHIVNKRVHPAAWGVRTALRRVPSQAESHDYNYRTPLVGLRENKPIPRPAAHGTWVEYGPHSKTPMDTARMAVLRTEEHAARHHVVTATTSEASVRAGGTFQLVDTGGTAQDLLLTRVTFRYRRIESADGGNTAWNNQIASIPSSIVFRPPRDTPWPRISGLLNAVVDGAIKGDYAELDDHGRYHLRMMYDRSGRTDLGATHPVRMMQPHAGANYGMHFPLRPGAEVLVGFVNGDPDRPVIVGSAPNPITNSPVQQKNQTQNVLRTGSNNEMVIEDEHGTERIRIHTPHKNTTVQLGAVEEPEEGALTSTDANISEASRLSNNEATARKTAVYDHAASLFGKSAIFAAGSPAVTAAAERGLQTPGSLSQDEITRDLTRLSMTPEKRAEEAKKGEEEKKEDTTNIPYGGNWSDVGADVTDRTELAMSELLRAVAAATDDALDRSKGRAQGEPLGAPLDPSAIVASDRTAALIGREMGVVFGDRIAALSSYDTASVVGRERALVKSPEEVELAAGKDIKLTTPGTLDSQTGLLRIVAGYYPAAEAPPLEEGTTIGVMSRRDLRMISVEDCILICAKKNVISTAHTGDMKLTAKKTVSITGGSIQGSAGSIKLKSSDTIDIDADGNITITSAGDIGIEAAGSLLLKGADVTVEGGSITLKGDTTVQGNLTVTGSLIGG